MKKGMVYLAGAGPGDPELLTLKALAALERADCVIYDYLASPAIVDGLGCEKIYVGKQGGDHTLSQAEINDLIVRKASEGKTVVRLKGGDPFIFGRGGEEAEELLKAGIRFSIIPGVSSFYSAPAYAGIPVTHRDHANAFEVITGHRRDDAPEDEDINYPDFDPEKTFVFLMGMKNLARIASKLTGEKGFPEDTPAAVVSWGTTPRQRVAAGTLKTIAGEVARERLKPPAIIVVGGVVALRERLRWFDTLPLFGKRIVVTRTREQASALSRRLAELGADVVEFPTIRIVPKAGMKELDAAIGSISDFDWIVFTSQNAVKIFFTRLAALGRDARCLHGARVAAIGPATARELEQHSVRPDLVPAEYVAEAVVSAMGETAVSGLRVLLPCAEEARDALREGLSALGAEVRRIAVYDTVRPDQPAGDLLDAVRDADVVTFTSSSTARNFFSLVKESRSLHASIGPITSGAVRDAGYNVDIEASEYTIDGLVDALVSAFG
jgi:uroporphyrinogen III methyltransferase/synthase